MYKKSNVPPDTQSLPSFLEQELSNIERAQSQPIYVLNMAISHASPAKVLDGMIVDADGVDWNPGSGAGLYRYRAGTWHFIG